VTDHLPSRKLEALNSKPQYYKKKKKPQAQTVLVILATWETEIGVSQFEASQEKS
jgi:hypothetical protein